MYFAYLAAPLLLARLAFRARLAPRTMVSRVSGQHLVLRSLADALSGPQMTRHSRPGRFLPLLRFLAGENVWSVDCSHLISGTIPNPPPTARWTITFVDTKRKTKDNFVIFRATCRIPGDSDSVAERRNAVVSAVELRAF